MTFDPNVTLTQLAYAIGREDWRESIRYALCLEIALIQGLPMPELFDRLNMPRETAISTLGQWRNRFLFLAR